MEQSVAGEANSSWLMCAQEPAACFYVEPG